MIANLARRTPFFYGWVIVAVVFVTMAIGVNARTAFSLLYPSILDEFHWDRGLTAGAFSFGFLISAILSPLIGKLMDARGPRVVNELGVLLVAAGLLLATLTSEPWHLYVTLGLLVGGGSVCLGYSGQSLFLPNWFVRRRGLATGLAFSGVGIGSIVLLPSMQAIIDASGWRTACAVVGVLTLVLLAPLNMLLTRRPQDLGLAADGDNEQAAAAGAAGRRSNVIDPLWAAVDWTLARALKTARFWWLASGYFCALFAWYAVQVHQTKYLVETGFSASLAAWALGAVSLAGIPGQILLGHVSDRVGREWVWAAGQLGFVGAYLALLLLNGNPSLPVLYAMILLQGMLGYGLTSVFSAIPAEIFEGRHFGTIFGTLMVAAIGGGAVGPWVTGLLHDRSGSYDGAFWIAIGLSLYSVAAIWLAAPRKVRSVAGRTKPEG